jgi:DNA-binding NtrC family response regulator
MQSSKYYILLVGEEFHHSHFFQRRFEEVGFKCHELFTVAQAKWIIQERHADIFCVITASRLPDGLGVDVAAVCKPLGVVCVLREV